jgi:shikimate dehydrogenase
VLSNLGVSSRFNFAVIGDPVEHSLSPRLFRILFDELQLDADYRALRTPPLELPERVKSIRSGELSGISVTLPHKESVIPLLDDLAPSASLVGAVNCLAPDGTRRAIGHNTDGSGFQSALEQAKVKLAGARVLILGSGGAARAAAFAAAKSGARSIVLANRTEARAGRLAGDLIRSGLAREGAADKTPARGTCAVNVLPLPSASITAEIADLIVNATSVGLESEEADPLPATFQLGPRHAVLDMVYRPLETRLLRRARDSGAVAIDGLWMLIHQALEQFRLWLSGAVPGDFAARLHRELGEEA